MLLHSLSMISSRREETSSGKVAGDLNNVNSNHIKDIGVLSKGNVGNMHETMFEWEFPSLGAEHRQGGSETGRVLSFSSSTSTQSLSAVIGNNGLPLALVGMPMTVRSNSTAVAVAQHSVSPSSAIVTPSVLGVSMAETLAQAPLNSSTHPKLRELAIKKSRQLIPVTPSLPKSLMTSPSEKSKLKVQQQNPFSSSPTASHSPRYSPAKADVPTSTLGNLRCLGASQDLNRSSSTEKDSLSPNASRIGTVNDPVGVALSPSGFTALRNKSNNTSPAVGKPVEKRLTSQAQSQNDFFKNLSRKTSSTNPCPHLPGPCATAMVSENSVELVKQVFSASDTQCRDAPLVCTSVLDLKMDSSNLVTPNAYGHDGSLKPSSNKEDHSSTNTVVYPDEEEAAFLRSLGWEENAA
ncbi:mediator of RNA polymerase II transcription subunit 1 isoform X2 [Quillaja saponaria]|uniref:Mediator of RNA polymerase II transcription subunit 1 isoform X2 n=1 Tax=Quillaja saponaria TaxID=32244 RepID=A0AAD7M1A5_QUISA|nr:mediator of RNA polymerase II transcription subunit 1 isoform X2 [Quillaja saponaria]